MVSVIWCARRHLKVQIVGLEVWGKNAGDARARPSQVRVHAAVPLCGRAPSVPGPLGLHSGGGTALGSSSSSISIRLLAVTLFLTTSELELAHCFTRRRPKPERACAAAAVRSCVRRGLPSCSWRLATLLKCHAVSRTAYIFPEGHSLPAADW